MKKLGLFASLMLIAACSKDIQNTEAVRQGILDDLQQRKATTGVDPGLLDINVSSVSFEKDQAKANVAFTPKNMPGGGGMSMTYVLERQGGKWIVKGRQVGGGNPHGAEGLPPAQPQQVPHSDAPSGLPQ